MHTPAPWTTQTRHTGGFDIDASFEDQRERVAFAVNPANARLIAAAPALLECLLSLTTTLPVDNFGRRSYKAAYESMIRQARAAISAATKD